MEANYEEVMNFGKWSLWGLLRTSLRNVLFHLHAADEHLTDFFPPPLAMFCIFILSIAQESQTYCSHTVIH